MNGVKAFLLVVLGYCALTTLRLDCDSAYFLHASQTILAGKRLYLDIVDFNLPLIFYLSTGVAYLAQVFQVHVIHVFKVVLFAFYLITLLSTRNIATGLPWLSKRDRDILLIALIVAGAYTIGELRPGERDHWFALAMIPYLLLRIGRLGRSFSPPLLHVVWIGAMAGLTSCFKPYFVITVFLLELFLLFQHRSRRIALAPECMAFVGVIVAFGIHFLFLPTAMNRAFWGEIVPEAMLLYHTFNKSPLTMVKFHSWIVALAVPLLILSLARPAQSEMKGKMESVLACFGLLAFGLFFLQSKGWSYHTTPFHFTFIIFLLFSLDLKALMAPSFRFLREGAKVAVLVIYAAGVYNMLEDYILLGMDQTIKKHVAQHSNLKERMSIREWIESESKAGDPVAVLSPNPSYAYPFLLQMGRAPATRYFFMYPFTFYNPPQKTPVSYRNRMNMTSDERRFVDRLAEDLSNNKPSLIFFVFSQHEDFKFLHEKFNIYDYLDSAGVLQAIGLRQDYVLLEKSEAIAVYKRRERSYNQFHVSNQ